MMDNIYSKTGQESAPTQYNTGRVVGDSPRIILGVWNKASLCMFGKKKKEKKKKTWLLA
jgi:hypothetical protein